MSPTRSAMTGACPIAARGRSGLDLPAVSLGLWQNFGGDGRVRDRPRDPAPRLRPRRHPFRSRQQLRPALRLGRGEFRARAGRRLRRAIATSWSISTKAGWDMWPGPYGDVGGIAQISDRELRPEPEADGARLCRHLLFAPRRSEDAARGDDGRARPPPPPGQGALCRHLLLLARADPPGRTPCSRPRACRC